MAFLVALFILFGAITLGRSGVIVIFPDSALAQWCQKRLGFLDPSGRSGQAQGGGSGPYSDTDGSCVGDGGGGD